MRRCEGEPIGVLSLANWEDGTGEEGVGVVEDGGEEGGKRKER